MDTDYIPLAGQIFTGAFTLIDLIFVIILLLLLLCSALISGSEVAYFSLSPSQLKYLEDNGYEKARNLQQKPNRLLATILISNNFVNVAIVVLSTYLVNSLFDFSAYPTLGFIIQVIVVTFVILLAGEIIPKLYANRSQLSMVIFMAGPLTFLSHLFRPLSALLIGSTSIISKRMDKKDNLSIDQLSKALELTKDTAINEEKDILEGIVRFGNIDAVDIIRPRINVIAIDGSSSYQQVKEDSFQEVEGDADTLAGLIIEIKGELTHKEEVITYKEHQFKVLEVDNRRIKKIQYKKTGQLPLSPMTAPKIS